MAVEGNYAYLACREAGAHVLDISDPANPQEVAWYETSGAVYHVAVKGNEMYLSGNRDGLYVVRLDLVQTGLHGQNSPADQLRYAAFPNPCTDETTFNVLLQQDSYVKLAIYSLDGQLLQILINN